MAPAPSAYALPSFVAFPPTAWRAQLPSAQWLACLSAWATLAEAYLALSEGQFNAAAKDDEQKGVTLFLSSFSRELASSSTGGAGKVLGIGNPSEEDVGPRLLKDCLALTERFLRLPHPPSRLLQWEFFADVSRVYGKKSAQKLLNQLPPPSRTAFETSLAALKKGLVRDFEATESKTASSHAVVEERLARLNSLIHSSPGTAAFFLAGSDFVDGLLSCYRGLAASQPGLRKMLLATAYLCLIGLTFEGMEWSSAFPKYAMLQDQLYSLKAVATSASTKSTTTRWDSNGDSSSLVVDLVTTTPLLEQIRLRARQAGALSARLENILSEMAALRPIGRELVIPPGRIKRQKLDKGKGLMSGDDEEHHVQQQMHMHRMSQITQVQDLFPELGSGFVAKLLDEYGEDTEQVVAHLLEGTLPNHLQDADRSEELDPSSLAISHHDLAPHLTPPPTEDSRIPARHNIFDNDDLDRLAVDTARLHFGKHDHSDATAPRSAPAAAASKAAVLSALAAFDADDDERDDTYDADDVGGTVDAASTAEDDGLEGAHEAALFRAHAADPTVFGRDAATRRGAPRQRLRDETGMTDEAIEGWALMLARNPQRRRRLEARFGEWGLGSGGAHQQPELKSTAWRASAGGSGAEDSEDAEGGGLPLRGGGGRGRGPRGAASSRGRGGGRGGSDSAVAGPASVAETEAARRRKEANKSSRANHNRRDQRARKMARGGFPG